MFDVEAFRAELLRCGYRTLRGFVKDYNERFNKAGYNMSESSLYYKLSGKHEFYRSEISNISILLKLSAKKRDKIFFA